ncbi:MAG: hypothetical protein HYU41_05585 [Candidatus Rokubacteria bacterium]|nr:hypothetical protein [Candidatus Rokubacteria bacterium]
MTRDTDRTTFLRRSLLLDGVASAACGALLLVAARPISTLIGLDAPGIAIAVGVGLLVYAAALFWNARRSRISRGEVLTAVVLNAVWVAASLVLIVDGPLTMPGNVLVAAVALAVLLFAVLEAIGLRRLREA